MSHELNSDYYKTQDDNTDLSEKLDSSESDNATQMLLNEAFDLSDLLGIDRLRYRGDQKEIEELANSIVNAKDGQLDEATKSKLQSLAMKEYESFSKVKQGTGGLDFTSALNEQLEKLGSNYRLKTDYSHAGIQDIGYISIDLYDKNSGKRVDGCGIPIDNSPRIPGPPDWRLPEWPPNPGKIPPEEWPPNPGKILPEEWPRLDIFEPPSKRR